MDQLKKYGFLEKQAVEDGELSLIGRQSMRTLGGEEVFAFRIAACDTREDRDHEMFDRKALEDLARLYVGRPILMDHNWSAATQTARIYAAGVEADGDGHRLILRAYMLRTDQTAGTIAAIEGGILREVSVGCRASKALCSVCGNDKAAAYCEHQPGRAYGEKRCVVTLTGVTDAYECSFVAVPAQPQAGVVKRYGGEETQPEVPAGEDPETMKALALLELEYARF